MCATEIVMRADADVTDVTEARSQLRTS